MPKNVSRTAASKKAAAEPEPDGAARLEQAPDKRSKTAPKRSEPASADPSAKNEPVAPTAESPAEALRAARAELGADVAVELTGTLSNRMAKALGLKPGALQPI